MTTIIALYVTAMTRLQDTRDRLTDDEGQTSMEWLGIAAVIIAIMVVLAGLSDTLGGAVSEAFTTLVERVTNVR